MHLCSNGHEEIAFASSWEQDCPACLLAEEVKKEMQEEIDDLEYRLEEAQNEIESLAEEINEHECE